MFHASTPQHSKDVIMGSLQDCHGTVRAVFASVAMGVGIDLHGVNTTLVLQAVLKTISKLHTAFLYCTGLRSSNITRNSVLGK